MLKEYYESKKLLKILQVLNWHYCHNNKEVLHLATLAVQCYQCYLHLQKFLKPSVFQYSIQYELVFFTCSLDKKSGYISYQCHYSHTIENMLILLINLQLYSFYNK